MPAFKATIKILLKNLPMILGFFIGFTIMGITVPTAISEKPFEIKKSSIAILNEDGESLAAESLALSLSSIAKIKELENQVERIQDALFYNYVEYVLIIPEGFSEKFFSGERIEFERMTAPDSYAGYQINNAVNAFINTSRAYKNTTNLSNEQIFEKAIADNAATAKVELVEMWKNSELFAMAGFSKFALYVMFMVVFAIMVAPVLVTKNRQLMARSYSAPIRNRSINFQIVLACFTFIFTAMIVYIAAGCVMFGGAAFTPQGLYMIANIVCVTVMVVGFTFFVGTMVKGQVAMNFACVVMAMLMCFIGGAFVPLEFMSENLMVVSRLTPGWWFVNNIDACYNTYSMTGAAIGSQLLGMLVQLLFAAAAFTVGLVIQRYKRVERS